MLHFKLIPLPLVLYSSHAITNDVSLAETAKAAEFFMADGVIVTGQATGDPALPSDFKGINVRSGNHFVLLVYLYFLAFNFAEVANNVKIPIMAGSGVTSSNLSTYSGAHALIIGSDFKRHGR